MDFNFDKAKDEAELTIRFHLVANQIKDFAKVCTLQDISDLFKNVQEKFPEHFEMFVDIFWSNFSR